MSPLATGSSGYRGIKRVGAQTALSAVRAARYRYTLPAAGPGTWYRPSREIRPNVVAGAVVVSAVVIARSLIFLKSQYGAFVLWVLRLHPCLVLRYVVSEEERGSMCCACTCRGWAKTYRS